MKAKLFIVVLIFIAFFGALRLPGVSIPYHQDEFKLAVALQRNDSAMWSYFFSHPPLQGIALYLDNLVFGNDRLRLMPIILSLISCFILYRIMKDRVNENSALFSVFLFTISAYSVWSSLMIDVDGAIMPFVFIVSLWIYDRWRRYDGKQKWKWLSLLGLSLLVGLFVKLSFILVVGTFIIDIVWENREKINKRYVLYGIGVLGGLFVVAGALMFLVQEIYPNLGIVKVFEHAFYFFHISGRNYIQVVVQGLKAVYYLSPLLILPILFIDRETFKKTRIFFIYLVLGFIFYFILFDFSKGALDKYLMYLVLPLAAISGTILANVFKTSKMMIWFLIGLVVAIALFYLNFVTHQVVPLYPKAEWFGRALHFEWNILNPFNGGSGPLGFYASFLFIAISFITSTVFAVIGFFKKEWRSGIAVVLIMIGLVYNAVLVEELLFGRINGNAPTAMRSAITFIKNSDNIKSIITYNDIGAYELVQMNKYGGRFYASPQFEVGHMKRFAEHIASGEGYFMVVDIPHINRLSFYGAFFSGCDVVFETKSGKIQASVYSCKK